MENVNVSNVKSVGKKSPQMFECKQKEFHVPVTVEPLYNEVLGIMNNIVQPSNSTRKEHRYNKTSS